MKTELDSAWESAIHNAERARKAEAEIERLQAELAEAKKEIALLKTPNLVWDFDDPENASFDSVADAVYRFA